MKLAANKSNLQKYAQQLLGNNYTPERERDLISLCAASLPVRRWEHRSHVRAEHLGAINKVLGTSGVEGMLLDRQGNDMSGTGSEQGVALDCQYCNAGDTYALTIGYVNGKLCIMDWGSMVEQLAA